MTASTDTWISRSQARFCLGALFGLEPIRRHGLELAQVSLELVGAQDTWAAEGWSNHAGRSNVRGASPDVDRRTRGDSWSPSRGRGRWARIGGIPAHVLPCRTDPGPAEDDRQALAQEVLPVLFSARAGLEAIDRALTTLSDEEIDDLIERVRTQADVPDTTAAAVIGEAVRAVGAQGRS